MKIRRLTAEGMERFHAELLEVMARERTDLSTALLVDDTLSEEVSRWQCDAKGFKSRWDVALRMDDLITRGKLEDYVRDPGLWGWLTVFYFDAICPRSPNGDRPDLKSSTGVMRYFPRMSEWRRYYRHLLAGPFMIYRAHADDPRRAMPLLATAVNAPGEAVEQIASRQELVTSAPVMQVLWQLYYNPKTGKLVRGAGRKDRGGVRRFVAVLQQFDVTYDLYSLSPERLLSLLPSEFAEFISAKGG